MEQLQEGGVVPDVVVCMCVCVYMSVCVRGVCVGGEVLRSSKWSLNTQSALCINLNIEK